MSEYQDTNLTKTRAKKLLFVSFDKKNTTILNEINDSSTSSVCPNIILTKVAPDEDDHKNQKYQIEFTDYKAARSGKTDLTKKFNSKILKVESALQQKKKANVIVQKEKFEEQKKSGAIFEVKVPKIILRNLSFRFTDDLLLKEMEKYGKIKLVNLPKKEDGKLFGYGFIVYENMQDAKKAIEGLNSRTEKLMGTKVVADWCLPKNIFLKNSSKPQETEREEDESDKEDNEDDSGSEEDEDEDDEPIKHEPIKKDEKLERKAKEGTQDVQEKRTVFIRNLSYDCTEESVKESFSKFGEIKYVKLCWDKELERPRGTAFIQFESSQSALDACAESDIMELDFRTLQIDMAVSRTQVNDIVEDKKSASSEPKDNRNLSLAKEGVIYPNSYEAQGLTKTELQKRQKLEAMNADKLKILHFFVSPTRLSVHNIPIKITDDELRAVFMKAIGEDPEYRAGKTRRTGIVECRIMRDLTRVSAGGVCKSKGYGFVEFTSFELAKKALYGTNNNPKVFRNGTRLIVQFSIEDIRALKKRKERIEKSKVKNTKNLKPFAVKDKSMGSDNVIEDEIENIKKIKEKNMIKVHMVEKKILKRKAEEENRETKKLNKKQRISDKRMKY